MLRLMSVLGVAEPDPLSSRVVVAAFAALIVSQAVQPQGVWSAASIRSMLFLSSSASSTQVFSILSLEGAAS